VIIECGVLLKRITADSSVGYTSLSHLFPVGIYCLFIARVPRFGIIVNLVKIKYKKWRKLHRRFPIGWVVACLSKIMFS